MIIEMNKEIKAQKFSKNTFKNNFKDFKKNPYSLFKGDSRNLLDLLDNKFDKLDSLLKRLRETFRVSWNEGVTLYTIRHSKNSETKELLKGKEILLRKESRETIQFVVKT